MGELSKSRDTGRSAPPDQEMRIAREQLNAIGEPDRAPVVIHDRVYDASNDSFPASDAPAWTGMSVGPAR